MEKLGSPQKGELWFQIAYIETTDWETLSTEAFLEIVTTDSLGVWQGKTKIRKELFLKTFIKIGDNLFQRTWLIMDVNEEDKTCYFVYSDPEGRIIDSEAKRLSVGIIEREFQFLKTAPTPEIP